MSGKFVIIPLFSDPSYEFNINLGANAYNFKFYLNSRQQKYHFDIYNDANEPLYLGLPLQPMTYDTYKLNPEEGFLALSPRVQNAKLNFQDVGWSQIPEHYVFFYSE